MRCDRSVTVELLCWKARVRLEYYKSQHALGAAGHCYRGLVFHPFSITVGAQAQGCESTRIQLCHSTCVSLAQ
ncbi:hypothetical protein GDO81_021751 [Engystomops pustulosus]|uniref:Uncharacterized protein n=1 Tax=Engystomops pustulosus TaxID=76066 RepID=A0AAV6YNA5_ENGPU|nr:hypothetical protein GDO81_021751 [Engystomops pustulosus]